MFHCTNVLARVIVAQHSHDWMVKLGAASRVS